MPCFTWLLLLGGGIFLILSLIRWFEQTLDAVDAGGWNKLLLLICFPFSAWIFPGRVATGRPIPAPRHEPVRGFGGLPKSTPVPEPMDRAQSAAPPRPVSSPPAQTAADLPPPGTPKEFLVMPVVPPRKPGAAKPAVDPDKLARLKQKMREQGMLGGDEDAP